MPISTIPSKLETLIVELVPSGYGGMGQNAAVAPFDFGAGYITVPFNTELTTDSRGVTLDPDNDLFIINISGVWRASFYLFLQGHNTSGNNRTTNLRLFNITKGTPGSSIVVPIIRNAADTVISASFITEVAPVAVGDSIRWEIGGGDAVIGGTMEIANFAINYLSELGELLPPLGT